MRLAAVRPSRRSLAGALAASALAACSRDPTCTPTIALPAGAPFAPSASDCAAAPAVPAGQPFTLSGSATFDLVPARYDPVTGAGGLDFAAVAATPIRGADVEVRQCASVVARATTDAAGRWTATFTPQPAGRIWVAVLARSADPPIQVQDNVDGGAVWAIGRPLDEAAAALDVHATHGFDGCAYSVWRSAGPFAVLDAMYTAARSLLDLPRDVRFDLAPLRVNWSPKNTPESIGITHYDPTRGEVFVLGADGIDTDEYDREVVVHEWAHYFEDTFSRTDTPGGGHGFGDVLDPRLAFSEGSSSALAAMLLGDPIYADTYWAASGLQAFGWSVESRSWADDPAPSAFSEMSVIRALWDLYDSGSNETWDATALGIGPIFDTLVGPQRTTPALTTLASFVAGLKQQGGVDAGLVDPVLARYGVGPITSEWGDGDEALRAMYTDVAAPSSTPLQLTASLDGRYAWNEQPQNHYYVFTATEAHATVSVSSTFDVDLEAYEGGRLLAVAWGPSGTETIQDLTGTPGFDTIPGRVYVVVLTGWGGVSSGQRNVASYSATVEFSSLPPEGP
ncbi:MAG TPA: hypothetical protein VFL83_03360 [Anaeromyxobacter sp.]|nr:hypothetical protein [Anaeromyxobacter sp.]